jgi:hypothetical protein
MALLVKNPLEHNRIANARLGKYLIELLPQRMGVLKG